MNAAVWFGAAIFFTCGANPVVSSQDLKDLLGANNYPYFSVAIGQLLAARYLRLYLACSVVALLHLLAEWLYFGKYPHRLWLGMILALCLGGMAQVYVVQPRLKALHAARYSRSVQGQAAHRAFDAWHSGSNALNLLLVSCLGVYCWRLGNPPNPMRFASATKFRS
jgi:hypothetical protein